MMITLGSFGSDPKPKKQDKKKPAFFIKSRSTKAEKDIAKYNKRSKVWREGKVCAVYNYLKADQVHHMRGRVGYADEWARLRGITLLHDERYWLAVSFHGHRRIEDNPQWAKENGFSFDRLEKK